MRTSHRVRTHSHIHKYCTGDPLVPLPTLYFYTYIVRGTSCYRLKVRAGTSLKFQRHIHVRHKGYVRIYMLPGTPCVRHKRYVRVHMFISIVQVIIWYLYLPYIVVLI